MDWQKPYLREGQVRFDPEEHNSQEGRVCFDPQEGKSQDVEVHFAPKWGYSCDDQVCFAPGHLAPGHLALEGGNSHDEQVSATRFPRACNAQI